MQDHPSSRSVENTIAAQKYGVGQPVLRKEDDTLVRGKGPLHRRSEPARTGLCGDGALDATRMACIKKDRHRRRKAMPGVLGVWTGEDLVAAGYGKCVSRCR